MQGTRAAAIALLVVVTALSGCFGSGDPADPSAAAGNTTAHAGPETGLVADTPEAKANATQVGDFQKSLDDRHHFHDMWGGKTELTVMDDTVQSGDMRPSFRQNPLNRQGATFGAVEFGIPDGQVVLAETKEILVTVTFDPSAGMAGMRLGWKNAREKWVGNQSDLLQSGATVSIPSSVDANDIPHATVSKWAFRLTPVGTGPVVAWNGTAHVTITIKRDPVLLLAPPHPDLWMNDTMKVLYHDTFDASMTWIVFPLFAPNPPQGFGRIELPDGVIVPPHTGILKVTMNWTNTDTTTSSFNPRPALAFSAADSRQWRIPDEVTVSGNTLTALIPVDAKMVDSPYDTTSNWFFQLYLDSDSPSLFGPFGQVATFNGKIELHIEAHREDHAAMVM